MKEQPRTEVTHFRTTNFKHKMKRLQTPQNLLCKVTSLRNFYVPKITAVSLSKIHFLKKAKKTCKPNNRNLNSD